MLIARSVERLEPYVPGEQPKSKDVVKLNTNENPYPPTPKCRDVLANFDLDKLRRYPDPEFMELRKAIAAQNGCDVSRVFVGNGSDEILSLAAKAFVENDGAIGSLDPSYSLYKTLAAIRDVPWRSLEFGVCSLQLQNPRPSNNPDSLCPSSLTTANCKLQTANLFLWTNPNAPTGEFVEPGEIAEFAKDFEGVVIVDEAYADFARANCMALATAPGNRNLIVMRTFSKSYSLAGLRVGYCVGPEDLIAALYKVKDSYNVDAIAQAVALAAYNDQEWMKANAEKIKATRRWFTAELEKRGWDVIPSESNFVFARPPASASAEGIFAHLKTRNIYVRYFKGPLTGDRLRITIGTDGQMKTLLEALDASYK